MVWRKRTLALATGCRCQRTEQFDFLAKLRICLTGTTTRAAIERRVQRQSAGFSLSSSQKSSRGSEESQTAETRDAEKPRRDELSGRFFSAAPHVGATAPSPSGAKRNVALLWQPVWVGGLTYRVSLRASVVLFLGFFALAVLCFF